MAFLVYRLVYPLRRKELSLLHFLKIIKRIFIVFLSEAEIDHFLVCLAIRLETSLLHIFHQNIPQLPVLGGYAAIQEVVVGNSSRTKPIVWESFVDPDRALQVPELDRSFDDCVQCIDVESTTIRMNFVNYCPSGIKSVGIVFYGIH